MKADFGDFMRFIKFLDAVDETVGGNEYHAVEQVGLAYEADVKRVAPIDVGTYKTLIRSEMRNGFTGPEAHVGDPMPYTMRLEYGFVGADSLGRVYNQAPRPHWRPMFDLNLSRYGAILRFELLKGVEMK